MRKLIENLSDYDVFCRGMRGLFAAFGTNEAFFSTYHQKLMEIHDVMSEEFGKVIYRSEIELANSHGNLNLEPRSKVLVHTLRYWVIENYQFPT